MEHLVSILAGPLGRPASYSLMALAFPRLVPAVGFLECSKYKFSLEGRAGIFSNGLLKILGSELPGGSASRCVGMLVKALAFPSVPFLMFHQVIEAHGCVPPCGSHAEGSRVCSGRVSALNPPVYLKTWPCLEGGRGHSWLAG